MDMPKWTRTVVKKSRTSPLGGRGTWTTALHLPGWSYAPTGKSSKSEVSKVRKRRRRG